MNAEIYALCLPVTNEPIYVGCTTGSATFRLEEHKRNVKKGLSSMLYNYLRENNITPSVIILESVDVNSRREAAAVENKWILELKASGKKLLNSGVSYNPNFTQKKKNVGICPDVYNAVSAYIDERGLGGAMGKFFEKAATERLQKLKNQSLFSKINSQLLISNGWDNVGGSFYTKEQNYIEFTGTYWLFNNELLTEQNYLEKIK